MNSQQHRIDVDPIFILNEKNILITKDFVNNIFKKYNINHKVLKLELYQTAMTHHSYSIMSYMNDDTSDGCHRVKDKEISMSRIKNPNIALPLQQTSYERLEFLGDAIIHAVLAEYIFNRFNDQQEGFMTRLRTKLENNRTLANFAQVIGLDNYILISRHMEELNSRNTNVGLVEDSFEAFIGALYTDTNSDQKNQQMKTNNFEYCRSLIIQLIENEIDIAELIFNEDNYKDKLLQYAHVKKWPDPIYGTAQVIGKENQMYKMYVKIKGNIEGIGCSNSKKKGEQLAAKEVLKKFHVLHDESDFSDDEYEMPSDENGDDME
jgi:dsRNA-specific ribonuclease